MALFKKKTEEKKEAPVAMSAPVSPALRPVRVSSASAKKHPGDVLRAPRITEKGTMLGGQGAYVFTVSKTANKKEIADAVYDVFKVRPRRVRIVRVPAKRMISRSGTRGTTASEKKAYVFLKKGDTIEIT